MNLNGGKIMNNKLFVWMTILLGVTACTTTPDTRIDQNYDEVVEHQSEIQKMSKILEASHSEEPEFVTALLDSWDCGDSLCVVGRAEIESDDASPFSCLEISKLSARANLLANVKTDLSRRVIHGMSGTTLSKQKLEAITTSGFTVKNVSNIRMSKNYYRKLLKDVSGSPVAVYQCYSVASLSKRYLKRLIEREAEKEMNSTESNEFKSQIDRIWESLFKLDSPGSDDTAPVNSLNHFDSYRDIRESAVKVAKAFQGLPYQLGGDISDGSLDCSNFTRLIYQSIGFSLPRISPDQFQDSRGVSVRGGYEKGDLLFFNGSLRPRNEVSHVAMYIGDGYMNHANGNSRKISIDNISEDYWQERLMGAKRFITTGNFPNLRNGKIVSQN